MARYFSWLSAQGGPLFDSYLSAHRWSVEHLEDFWKSIWDFSGLISSQSDFQVLERRTMPGAKWFPAARLNFAENLLRIPLRGDRTRVALTAISESRPRIQMTYGELFDQVAAFAAFLKTKGIQPGDRVAGILPNGPEAVVAMLASTSLGAIWSCSSPDFGVQGIFDRFHQIEPKILISVDGYRYNGKKFPILDRLEEIRRKVPSIQATVIISEKNSDWKDAIEKNRGANLTFAQLPFDHPVYILYSSGTTGAPKCIVHGAGGVLLQHSKELMVHTGVTERDKFFYFTTCGWMMWNWLVSGLMTGAELILFDGSPSYPSLDRLWQVAEEEKISIFGTSAKFIGSNRSAKMTPGKSFNFRSIRTILSTGSPLLPEDFDWVYSSIHSDVLLSSIAGGTDIVSCFVLGNPMLPVVRGEIQCKGLGMDVVAFSQNGEEIVGEKGELVCRAPAPSMPVRFWNDPNGEKYQKAYFDRFPGVWWHGDYIEFNERGGAIIYGRSDVTLNPSGVRIGTAEIYRQVETIEEIKDSLVVAQPWEGDERIVLFVLLDSAQSLTPELEKKIRTRIRENTTPRHVPAKIISISEIPYTISGKKVELAVTKILRGERVENRDALANPKSLDFFRNLPELKN